MILLNNICLFLNKLYKYIYYNYCIYKDIDEKIVDEKNKKNDQKNDQNNYKLEYDNKYEHMNDYEFDYEIIDNMNNNNKIVR
jgi:hypothetical protein